MQTPRERFLKLEQEAEDKQLSEIMTKPTLSPKELWLLTEKNFILWRKEHDYPKLLASFDEKLPLFRQWREAFALTHEELMDYTITRCIAPKIRTQINREKYLIEVTQDGKVQTFVSDENISDRKKDGFGRPATYQLLKTFIPYSDWRKANPSYPDFFIHPTKWHSPGTDAEQVFLETGHELLKMGGLDVPINGANVLVRSKALEFVNLSRARFNGKIYFGENTALTLTYCFADGIIFNNAQIDLVSFFWSKLPNLRIADSAIQQWRFVGCDVGGDVISSKLRWVEFIDGNTTLDFDNVRLDYVSARGSVGLLNSNYMYRVFKKIYSDQGDDELSGIYYVNEREVDRKRMAEIPFTQWKSRGFWAEKLKYVRMTLAFYYWRYGKSPHRVLFCSLLLIFFCAGIYYFNQGKIATDNPGMDFIDCVYFSTMTFTTVGYGDYAPTGFLRIVASIEAFLGVANFGFLISGYTASKY